MKCCVECFTYDRIKKHIEENDEIGKCDFCDEEETNIIESSELYEIITVLTNLYESVEEVLYADQLQDFNGHMLWELLYNEWDLFNFDDSSKQQKLLEDILSFSYKSVPPSILTNYVLRRDHFRPDNEASDIMLEMWLVFEKTIKEQNRFFIDRILDLKLLKNMIEFCKCEIPQETEFLRVRINNTDTVFNKDQMGKPPHKLASPGRANPKGISYLYLAEDDSIAVHESRPFLHDNINLGFFQSKSPLTIIDLSSIGIPDPFEHGYLLSDRLEYLNFLRYLGSQLSRPINPENADIEYLPTQYLCEYIKSLNYQGIKYKSQFGVKCNFVFFDSESFECNDVIEYEIQDIKHAVLTFEEVIPKSDEDDVLDEQDWNRIEYQIDKPEF